MVLAAMRPAETGASEYEARCWSVATGEQLAVIPNTKEMALAGDGRTLVTISGTADPNENRLTLWDLAAHKPRAELSLRANEDWHLIHYPDQASCFSPDGRVFALGGVLPPALPLKEWADRLGVRGPFEFPGRQSVIRLLDVHSGRWRGDIPAQIPSIGWLANGTALATLDDDSMGVRVWDVPPRKPLVPLTVAAAVWAIPLAVLARRRVRRLRPAVA
jgi:WD40 repeat protein